jgi:hypothetical protein
MRFFKDLGSAFVKPLPLILEYRDKPRILLPAVVSGACCLANTVMPAIAGGLAGTGNGFSVWQGAAAFLVSAASLLISCLVFLLLARLYKKDAGLRQIFSTWGLSYLPTLLCIAAVEFSESFFYAFMAAEWPGIVLCTFLILLLAWKTILYFIELNVVLGLKSAQTAVSAVITFVVYALVLFASMRLGLKVPML